MFEELEQKLSQKQSLILEVNFFKKNMFQPLNLQSKIINLNTNDFSMINPKQVLDFIRQ